MSPRAIAILIVLGLLAASTPSLGLPSYLSPDPDHQFVNRDGSPR